jgi:hypothetical protein
MNASPTDAIDAALIRLDELDTAPLPKHAAVYEQVHRDLCGALESRPPVTDAPPLG